MRNSTYRLSYMRRTIYVDLYEEDCLQKLCDETYVEPKHVQSMKNFKTKFPNKPCDGLNRAVRFATEEFERPA